MKDNVIVHRGVKFTVVDKQCKEGTIHHYTLSINKNIVTGKSTLQKGKKFLCVKDNGYSYIGPGNSVYVDCTIEQALDLAIHLAMFGRESLKEVVDKLGTMDQSDPKEES